MPARIYLPTHIRTVTLLLIAVVGILTATWGPTVSAHEGRAVGDYILVVGFLQEPAYEGPTERRISSGNQAVQRSDGFTTKTRNPKTTTMVINPRTTTTPTPQPPRKLPTQLSTALSSPLPRSAWTKNSSSKSPTS